MWVPDGIWVSSAVLLCSLRMMWHFLIMRVIQNLTPLVFFCQMLGPRGTAAVTLIPRDADEKCCQSKAIQHPSGTIDRC